MTKPKEMSRCHLVINVPGHQVPKVDALSPTREKQISVVIGLADSPVWLWLEEHVKQMSVGEHVTLTKPQSEIDMLAITDFIANGDQVENGSEKEKNSVDITGDYAAVSESQTNGELTVHVTLVSVEQSKDVYQLTSSEKLDFAQQLKDSGSRSYKNNYMNLAFQRYSRALKYGICAGPPSQLEEALHPQYRTIVSQCYFNMAACQITSVNFTAVIHNCTKGLESDPGNVKGLYRRAQALCKLSRYEEAVVDLEAAADVEPLNQAVQRLLLAAQKLVQRQHQNMANAMSKMFT